MTKSKLSKIFKEAHRRTKVISKQYKVNYKTQLSLELKNIYKEIKAYKIAKKFVSAKVNLNDYVYGSDRKNLINSILRESNLKRFSENGCIKGIDFAKKLSTTYKNQTIQWLGL